MRKGGYLLIAVLFCFGIALLLPNLGSILPSTDLLETFRASTRASHACTSDKEKVLEAAEVIPDVLTGLNPKPSKVQACVRYGVVLVSHGVDIKPSAAKSPPAVNITGSGLFALVLSDPDAPSPAEPTNREWLHWLVTNIRDGDLQTGTMVMPYAQPDPPKGTHRYVFSLFKQPELINIKQPESRAHFSTMDFAIKNSLGEPVLAVFFTARPE